MRESGARLGSLLALLVAWQLLAAAAQSLTLPTPWAVTQVIVQQASSGDLWLNLSATLARVVASFTIAMCVGVALGMWMGASKTTNQWLDPLLIIALKCQRWSSSSWPMFGWGWVKWPQWLPWQ